jgi:GNAT superfamily N-acetyltransferase
MGLRYLATHQSVEITRDRIAKGTCFVAELDSRIIGTVTYYGPETVTRIPWMDEDRVAWFGQFGVEPHLQGQGIGSRLVDHVEAFAGAHDVDQLALDTAEPATHLIEWYERLGYEFVEYVNWEETNYRSVIMRKRLR